MARDFLTKQARIGKIIGNNPTASEPKLIVYSDENAADSVGGFSTGLTSRLANVGLDTFIYIDGIPGSKKAGTANTVTVFGGDVVVSGCLYQTHSGTSLWELDPLDDQNLVPTNIIDGDTGLFAIDFDNDLESQYTLTQRSHAVDKYFEFDILGNIIPKDVINDAC